MVSATLKINNRDARRLWLAANGLGQTPTGPLDVMAIIRNLGFVQIDTVRNVTRAHNHIIWSRNQNFREGKLWPLLQQRQLFEHFTHDASLIPMEVYPMWQRQFERKRQDVLRTNWYRSGLPQSSVDDIIERIRTEGPLSTHAFDTKIEGKREMWARPPHKKALDMMWYCGELATARRTNFVKYYDLASRFFPAELRAKDYRPDEQAKWLHDQALDRLWFADFGEIRRFWDASSPAEVTAWLDKGDLCPVSIERADGATYNALARADIGDLLQDTPEPTSRLRILNPFDPAIRDRTRLQRLFGFEYRNEMFVPKAKRKWGYYVYPLLEKDRFVGRIELRADRKQGELQVIGFWAEPGVKWPAMRHQKLDAELDRFARYAGLASVCWQVCR